MNDIEIDRQTVFQRGFLPGNDAPALEQNGASASWLYRRPDVKNLGARAQWQEFLTRNRLFRHNQLAPRHIAERPFKPYLRPWLSAQDKVNLLIGHYTLITSRFPDFPSFVDGQELELASLPGKSGTAYKVTLGRETTKEGELYFAFVNASKERLATLRVAFERTPDGRAICWIGGVQGGKPPVGREAIVIATRDLHGLRPKHAVLQAACALSEQLGVSDMIAPRRRNHISQRGWRRLSIKRKITADYDDFWSCFTSSRTTKGDFIIPLPLARRQAHEVKAKKRREWTRRYELLDLLHDKAAKTLSALSR